MINFKKFKCKMKFVKIVKVIIPLMLGIFFMFLGFIALAIWAKIVLGVFCLVFCFGSLIVFIDEADKITKK